MKKIFSVLIAVASASAVCAQNKTYNQVLYWLRYQNQLFFKPNLFWNNEIDTRRFINPDVQNQVIFHSRVHYQVKRWDFAGGFTYSWAYAAIPQNGYRNIMAEARPVVEVSYERPLPKLTVQHRIRVDNRFFQETPQETVWTESEYILRLRYRLQARIPLKNDPETNSTRINLRIADEIMVNHKDNFFDQNRIYVTADYVFSRKLAIETGYIYIYQKRMGREEFFNRHVLRFSILHRVYR